MEVINNLEAWFTAQIIHRRHVAQYLEGHLRVLAQELRNLQKMLGQDKNRLVADVVVRIDNLFLKTLGQRLENFLTHTVPAPTAGGLLWCASLGSRAIFSCNITRASSTCSGRGGQPGM